ncbi:uncharacterized protein LOC141531199 [Cotesia typhae]|uniref:uncharacterized protein LOC141531199 n=1 Tax=Cotesia typhae TaxID=2053667 RepID=UPI003D681EA7
MVREKENEIEKILLIGDLNARIGECDVNKIDAVNEKQRSSKDKKINGEGKKLLKLSEELGLKILNGVKSGDEEGEITFVGGKSENCCSVLDLVLMLDRGENDGVKSLMVIERIESDHLPVIVELERKNISNEMIIENREECKGLKKIDEERLIWKKDNVVDYTNAAYDEWQEKKENSEEMQWNDIKEIVYNAARTARMSKKPNSGKKRGDYRKEWFNGECKRLRAVVWEKLKNMLKSVHEEERKKEYAEAKKIFKCAVRKARDDWWGEKKREIAKAKDMSSWWEAINKFRKKKRKNKNNNKGAKIDGERWVEHFYRLLNKYEPSEEERTEVNNEEDMERESSEDERLDEEFG